MSLSPARTGDGGPAGLGWAGGQGRLPWQAGTGLAALGWAGGVSGLAGALGRQAERTGTVTRVVWPEVITKARTSVAGSGEEAGYQVPVA